MLHQELGYRNKFSANQSEEYVFRQSGWRDMSSAKKGGRMCVLPIRVGNMLCFHQSELENDFCQSEHGNVFSANQGERILVCVPPIRVIEYVFRQSEKGKICYAYQIEGKCITPIKVWESVFHQPL